MVLMCMKKDVETEEYESVDTSCKCMKSSWSITNCLSLDVTVNEGNLSEFFSLNKG